jgi:hypothetical protein
VPSYFIRPVPLVGKVVKDKGADPKSLQDALRVVNGVNHAHVFDGSAEMQFDAEVVDVAALYKMLEDGKIQFKPTTHFLVSFGLDGAGDFKAVESALNATVGTLWMRGDSASGAITLFMGGKIDKELFTKVAVAAGYTGVKDLTIR